MEKQKQIIFVYNANATLYAKLTDYAHKLLRPKTYPCSLCKLTYGNLGMKREWKSFISKLPYTVSFLHKDEFLAKYPKQKSPQLPVVLEMVNGRMYEKITSREINNQKTLKELEQLVKEKL